ncbi:MAG: SCO family protein [Gammaproteobacteria bacterium]|nr:SCO family protein [Gammaproteobacteria bacterium]MDH5652904.1 SCO family protein [Gammaproteobacteria bacterium]
MKFFEKKSGLIAGILTLIMLPVMNSAAMTDKDTAIQDKSRRISKQEWERARNYFTDTVLVNQHGKNVRFYSDVLDGRVVIMNVMYTDCKGSCPLTTKMMTQLKERLGKRFGKEIQFVSISNNPDKDTPESLTEFAKKQHALSEGWSFLTGDKADINKIISKLGFFSKNYEEHTSLLVAGNTRTGHWIKIKPGTPLPAIVIKLTTLADEG